MKITPMEFFVQNNPAGAAAELDRLQAQLAEARRVCDEQANNEDLGVREL